MGVEEFDFSLLREQQGDPEYAVTEFISDTLVANGTRFTNAWSNPLCSPTRAAIQTGKFGFRTGIGDIINDDAIYGLDVDDGDLLPKLLASTNGGTTAYETGVFGKWHLGTSDGCAGCAPDQGGDSAPEDAGYGDFDALLFDKQSQPFTDKGSPYFEFTITREGPHDDPFDADIDGPNEDVSIYATSEVIDRAITWINNRESANESFFAYVPFFAAHGPWACPFSTAQSPYPGESFECDPEENDDDKEFRSMIETIDIEIKRVVDELDDDAVVIVAIDNGTPDSREIHPWDTDQVKGSVGQGGVLVPLIFWGDGVEQGETVDHSVNMADLFATILDFAGKDTLIPNDVDSKSLKDLVTGTLSTRPHDFNYTEVFFPNFEPGTGFGPCRGEQAVQEDPGKHGTGTYKYIRTFDGAEEALYELDGDPEEDDNIIDDNPPASRLAALESHIDSTLQSDLASLCDTQNKGETGDSCTSDSDCCSNLCSSTTQKCLCPM